MLFFNIQLDFLDAFHCNQFRDKWKAHGVDVRQRSQFRKKPQKQHGTLSTQFCHVEIPSIFQLSGNIQTLFY